MNNEHHDTHTTNTLSHHQVSAKDALITTLPSGFSRYVGFYRANQWWFEPINGEANITCIKPLEIMLVEHSDNYSCIIPRNKHNQRLAISYDGHQLTLEDQFEHTDDETTYDYIQSNSTSHYLAVELAMQH